MIPAFNEVGQIEAVLDAAKAVTIFDEIVVVDDGSLDETAAVARARGVTVLELPENRGKGAALQAGIKAVKTDIVVFSDADIVGLKERHFNLLIQPLLDNTDLMMTVGKFSGGRLRTDLSQSLIPAISGQRAARRKFLTSLPDMRSSRFGVEILITRHAKATGSKIMEVALHDLTQVMKEEKMGVMKGMTARLKMYREMSKSFFE